MRATVIAWCVALTFVPIVSGQSVDTLDLTGIEVKLRCGPRSSE